MVTTEKRPTATRAAQPQARITRILVPFDFGGPAHHALAYAKELAGEFGASLQLLHVLTEPYMLPFGDAPVQALATEAVAALVQEAEKGLNAALTEADRARFDAGATVVRGDARGKILERARDGRADLIVMGTRGRTGADHVIFGSVAEYVVRHAPCPVLIVH